MGTNGTSTLHRLLPRGPVYDQIVALCGTDTPRSSSIWRDGARGREFFGAHGRACVYLHGPEPHRHRVMWFDEHGAPHQAEWRAVVTWEQVR